MATNKTAQCGNVDPFTKGICLLPAGHAYSHEVRFDPRPTIQLRPVIRLRPIIQLTPRHAGHCTSPDAPVLSCPSCG